MNDRVGLSGWMFGVNTMSDQSEQEKHLSFSSAKHKGAPEHLTVFIVLYIDIYFISFLKHISFYSKFNHKIHCFPLSLSYTKRHPPNPPPLQPPTHPSFPQTILISFSTHTHNQMYDSRTLWCQRHNARPP